MGHTIVSVFSDESTRWINDCCCKGGIASPNKIPYGKCLNREKTNGILPYHMTMVHWGKESDDFCLKNLKKVQFQTCCVSAIDCSIYTGAEKSGLVCINVFPDHKCKELREQLVRNVGGKPATFWHITLAVDKNMDRMKQFYRNIKTKINFPFVLQISALEVYHIWELIRFVKRFE